MRKKKSALVTWVSLTLLAVPTLLVASKIYLLGYSFRDVLPRTQYTVALHFFFDGHGGDVRIRTFLPVSDSRQQISDEQNLSPGMHASSEMVGSNRLATWGGARVGENSEIVYRYSVLASAVRYELDDNLPLPSAYPSSVAPYLKPEKDIQVDSPEITKTAAAIGATQGSVTERLRKIYELTSGLRVRPFKGTTDALTALRLGEASCNGKSRLFVALARAVGIPARLVGGFIMKTGSKRTSHQWVEAYVAGHWVPFDPTNGYFAELSPRHLTLYYGDEVLFRHTSDINFKYRFETTAQLVPSPRAKTSFRIFNVWALFERLGLSFLLLRTILMLPIGALVVVLFRNVIGMPTFGTFLPALIAAAAGETGLLWGILGVLTIVAVAALTRWAFHRLELLHSPSLAILLAAVGITMLATALFAEQTGLNSLAYILMFPIAVLAITAERFYLALTEKGPRSAFKDLAGTIVVISACYLVMNSLALQILLIGFPEVLLVVAAMNVYLGRWVGVRLFEYLRFRKILFARGPA